MGLKKIIIYIAFFLLFYFKSAGNDIRSIDSFFNLSEKQIEVNFEKFIYGLSIYKIDSSLFFLNLVESKLKDKESKEYTILISEIANTYNKLNDSINYDKFYNQAISIALRNDYYKELTNIYLMKADICKSKNILDSAMYYSLLSIETGNKAEEFNKTPIYHLIADIYYTLEMYDEAKIYYLKAIELGENFPSWEDWRKIVIYTNIGNIFTDENNFKNAKAYFNVAISQFQMNERLISKDISYIQGAHLYNRYANLFYAFNFLDSAEYYINLSIEYLEKDKKLKDLYSYIYVTAGKIQTAKGNYITAEKYLKIALEKMTFNSLPRIHECYYALSKNYEKQSNIKLAYEYLIKYETSFAEFRNRNNFAKLMQYKMMKDLEIVSSELEKQKIVNQIIIIVIVFLLLIFLMLVYFKIKINKSDKLLINKILELISLKNKREYEIKVSKESSDLLVKQEKEFDNLEFDENDLEESVELRQELRELAININDILMDNPIIYDNSFSINDLSQLLRTNRNYISKAINSYYNMTFQLYINELRIISVIKMMRNNTESNNKMDYFMEKVGFVSRSTFNSAFKRYTGMTPSSFYKRLQSEEE